MTTIDELGRRAAAAARADAADMAAARVEPGLARLRVDDCPIVTTRQRRIDPRRWLALGVAAALAAAAIIALVIKANQSERHRLVPSTQVTTPPTHLTSPPTTVGSTAAPTTTEAPAVVPADAFAVSYDALPPAYTAKVFARVEATDPTRTPLVAIGDTRIVTVDSPTSTATLIDPFSPESPPQQVPLDVTPVGNIAAGPGDVLYGVVQGSGGVMTFDAIALSGDRAGQVIASAPSGLAFDVASGGLLGHGADGIIDRRTGETLLGYVDVTGAPTSLGRPAHAIGVTAGDLASGDFAVHDPDGAHDWNLVITRDPTYLSSHIGDPLGAPSSHGGAVVWSAVGTPDDPSSDVGPTTVPVVAVLAADGAGTWRSLTDGWQVGASDLDGTILVRVRGSNVELARLDPPQRYDFLDQPAAPHQRVQFAATLPTTLTTAPPCTIDHLAIVPTEGAAMGTNYGILYVRNEADQPCQVSGVPDVALLDEAGNIVQSTDPALLAQPGSGAIVLEKDSWATALLGRISSNVCGGNESSQFRLTIAGQSTVVPFTVGRPFDSTQCDSSYDQPPVPGALMAEPVAAVDANTGSIGALDDFDVTLDAPSTVRAGDVLRYDVLISAQNPPEVLSDNCPIYTEALGTTTGQFLLNCNGSDGIVISADEHVRFHIELQIPADAPPGATTLTWAAVEPSGPQATTTVTIVA